ncbi:MAG: transposase [Erysipelotrichaceae bacterium]|nr:transposase [Erysipelotrichaceae bacterium]
MIDLSLHNIDQNSIGLLSDFDSYKKDLSKPRIKEIIWNNLEWLESIDESGIAREVILDNVYQTLLCKTVYLGFDAFDCDNCDNWIWLFRHCHSRFCSSCGIKLQKTLASKAETMCIDIKHRHMVFTIPEEYRELFRKDRESLNILFVASRNTLMKLFNNSLFNKVRRKKGIVKNPKDNYYLFRNYNGLNEFGEIATLHTFGRDLKWNPHIHALVPELIYNSKKNEIKRFNHFNYASLRHTWMYEVNRLLLERYPNDKIIKRLIDNSYKKRDHGFYVYAKVDERNKERNLKDVNGCVSYMMRYAGRPVMAESRITSYDSKTDSVSWWYEDHKTEKRIVVNETGKKLLGKMIIHIPDKHFRMIRYYGFYSNKSGALLDKINELLGKKFPYKHTTNKQTRKYLLKKKLESLKFRTHIADSYNRDILKCGCSGTFRYVYTCNPLEGKRNDRYYKQGCINEMRSLWLQRSNR